MLVIRCVTLKKKKKIEIMWKNQLEQPNFHVSLT